MVVPLLEKPVPVSETEPLAPVMLSTTPSTFGTTCNSSPAVSRSRRTVPVVTENGRFGLPRGSVTVRLLPSAATVDAMALTTPRVPLVSSPVNSTTSF